MPPKIFENVMNRVLCKVLVIAFSKSVPWLKTLANTGLVWHQRLKMANSVP
jgi:hypothetical protein